ncbi:MAG: bifunctional (p)ppGpp synthetase/guanosine-3',5'-bis(diphosphate) 3'-pyrophosphohydrolase [Oscillospiraceae bacterium]|nr:bifunctional (p)ppGpp synthetase/guanosine-3',5'-bis(diphosphate) 3'-pyrophosphohydrolase [Oscillospiraceae bacterium]
MEAMLENLINRLSENNKILDFDLIKKAYYVAYQAHKGQKRKSGEDYIIHPIEVSIILSNYGMDTETIIAGLLHDVVEDTDITIEEINKIFGSQVGRLVAGVTKISKISYVTIEDQKAENIRKMIVAMAEDIRVIIIKLADRLHNIRTIEYLKGQKRRDKALETMEIYAPLAHRLGMKSIKDQLEDLSLRQLDIIAYREIEEFLKVKKSEREKIVEKIKATIKKRLNYEENIAHVEGRAKSVYSVYKKVYQHGHLFDEVYDVYAVRIIVDTENECYEMLGMIHDMFKPLPNRFKDYISTPKTNMYQSLHTTVIDENGIIFEVQIRTWEMHYTAEYGIAAHWKYKAGINKKTSVTSIEEKLTWVKKLLENQQEATDVDDIIRSIKYDLTSEEIYFFTPKGDVKSLPVGSTIIDFAYSIHSQVGDKLIGAKVDGKIVPITYEIKTGQVVYVLTSSNKDQGPSRDWLKIVKTSQARNKIRSWFKKEKREENILAGKQDFERELRRNHMFFKEDEYTDFVNVISKKYHYNTSDEFFAAIGYGGLYLSKVIAGARNLYNKKNKDDIEDNKNIINKKTKISNQNNNGIIVEDLGDCLVRLSKCCSPLPGDEIVGFVTRGFGVSVHRSDCKNVEIMKYDKEYDDRWVKVSWASEAKNTKEIFKCNIKIIADSGERVLADITSVIANFKVSIYNLNAKEKGDKILIEIVIGVSSLKKIKEIMSKISKVKNVISVDR